MTICECMDACYDRGLCKAKIILWHDYPEETRKEIVYNGPGDEIPDRLDVLEFDSFDVPTRSTMTFNVHIAHDMTRRDELQKYGHYIERRGKAA